jgi:hypothetical protein
MGKAGRMGPATPLQWALGVPWGGRRLRRRLFCSNLARAGAANSTFFWAGLILSARRDVVSLVVTDQRREKFAYDTPTSPATGGLISEFWRVRYAGSPVYGNMVYRRFGE